MSVRFPIDIPLSSGMTVAINVHPWIENGLHSCVVSQTYGTREGKRFTKSRQKYRRKQSSSSNVVKDISKPPPDQIEQRNNKQFLPGQPGPIRKCVGKFNVPKWHFPIICVIHLRRKAGGACALRWRKVSPSGWQIETVFRQWGGQRMQLSPKCSPRKTQF